MFVYKIRDKQTGLYSLGGVEPEWGKIGKVWVSEGALKSHLTLYRDGLAYPKANRTIPDDWEIVTFSANIYQFDRPYSARQLADRPAKK